MKGCCVPNRPEFVRWSAPAADMQNWEQRVNTELKAAYDWNENWGEIYGSGKQGSVEDQIRAKEAELRQVRCPAPLRAAPPSISPCLPCPPSLSVPSSSGSRRSRRLSRRV